MEHDFIYHDLGDYQRQTGRTTKILHDLVSYSVAKERTESYFVSHNRLMCDYAREIVARKLCKLSKGPIFSYTHGTIVYDYSLIKFITSSYNLLCYDRETISQVRIRGNRGRVFLDHTVKVRYYSDLL